MKATRRIFSVLIVLCLLLSITVAVSAADPVILDSATTTVSVYGNTYSFFSRISNSTVSVIARGVINSSSNVQVGYMGIKGRAYDEDGVLVSANDWAYNDSSTKFFSYGTYYSASSGCYYAKSQVKLYNGNGYNTYTCNATPYVYLVSRSLASVNVNERGETYGSELILSELGVEVDLIKAVGDNGQVGYVKDSDLNIDSVDTLQDAMSYMNNIPSERILPLYSEDGITVIGTFTVTNDVGC